VTTGALLAAIVVFRTVTATSAARRALVPVLLPGAVVGATQAAYAVALLRDPLEPATSFEFSSLFLVRALALTALALGLAWTVVRARRLRAAVVRLTSDLGEAAAPGTLREALAAAVGDGSLEIAYWLPASGRYVDAAGQTVEPPAVARGRTVTSIVRGARPLAVVAHDSALVDSVGLEQRLGSATRLAVENERLQAEVLAQLEDLRASRARIVESGDAARRRLERDLHDGAQQRLLALSYDLRLARSAAEDDGDPELTRQLDVALDEAQAALLDLRELAHGIYPAILGEAGLASALATLADEAPLAVELGEVPGNRYGTQIETAAYLVAAEAIGEAASRGAGVLTACVMRVGDRLVVTTGDDGGPRGPAPVYLADRIGALGGSIAVTGATLRAEIPCA
jgi:signal transduction histidine kinase